MKHKQTIILLLIFAINKLIQNYFSCPTWFSSYADDFMLIPVVFGCSLWIQQNFVNPNFKFSIKQIVGAWVFLSIYFEAIAPKVLHPHYTSDPIDVIVYAFGGVFYYLFLNQGAEKVKV